MTWRVLLDEEFKAFQLTSSQGGWRFRQPGRFVSCRISTHILTRRMTGDKFMGGGEAGISTHILTRRMTASLWYGNIISSFQLTSSRRGWQWYWWHCKYHSDFNSHPHEEDDQGQGSPATRQQDFNSHPHEEDDTMDDNLSLSEKVFQLTSSRRGWRRLKRFL